MGEFRREVTVTSNGKTWQEWWLLAGDEGVVQFVVYISTIGVEPDTWGQPRANLTGFDRGYHWPTPRYDGQVRRECDRLPGGHCYYDGSSLAAEEGMALLLAEGSEAVWSWLADYYEGLVGRAQVGGFGEVIETLIAEPTP